MPYNCVIILGPTAVGKTAIGVNVASYFNAEIISADSRQTYCKLDIGSGKDLCEYAVNGKPIPYHLIDVTELPTEYSVFDYQAEVEGEVLALFCEEGAEVPVLTNIAVVGKKGEDISAYVPQNVADRIKNKI